jgi:hypothetical protein
MQTTPREEGKHLIHSQAKYRIVNVPLNGKGKYSLCDYVCSKCAVTLVTQGYKVIIVTNSRLRRLMWIYCNNVRRKSNNLFSRLTIALLYWIRQSNPCWRRRMICKGFARSSAIKSENITKS